jgi:hypothetical protein
VHELTGSQLRTFNLECVEVFYNRERHQAIHGYLTPAVDYATALGCPAWGIPILFHNLR